MIYSFLKNRGTIRHIDKFTYYVKTEGLEYTINDGSVTLYMNDGTFVDIKLNERLPTPEDELQRIGNEIIQSLEIKRWLNRFNLKMEDLK